MDSKKPGEYLQERNVVVDNMGDTGDKGHLCIVRFYCWSESILKKYAIFHKAVDISSLTSKEVGNLGENIACEYLRRHGFTVRDRNVLRKTGELDIVAETGDTLHFVEVKTILTNEFPRSAEAVRGEPGDYDEYDPSLNLHEAKIRKVSRTGEWYVLEKKWEGDWQVDGLLVWLRRRDGMARVSYLPQIV